MGDVSNMATMVCNTCECSVLKGARNTGAGSGEKRALTFTCANDENSNQFSMILVHKDLSSNPPITRSLIKFTENGGGLPLLDGISDLYKIQTASSIDVQRNTEYTAPQMLSGLIIRDCNGVSRTDTILTGKQSGGDGTGLVANIPNAVVGTTFDLTIVNISGPDEDITLQGVDTYALIKGVNIIKAGECMRVQIRVTDITSNAEIYELYTLGTVGGGGGGGNDHTITDDIVNDCTTIVTLKHLVSAGTPTTDMGTTISYASAIADAADHEIGQTRFAIADNATNSGLNTKFEVNNYSGGTLGRVLTINQDGNVQIKGPQLYKTQATSSISTTGPVAYSVVQMLSGVIIRDCGGESRIDTIITGKQSAGNGTGLVANIPNAAVGTTFELLICNTSDGVEDISLQGVDTYALIKGEDTIKAGENMKFTGIVTDITLNAEIYHLFSHGRRNRIASIGSTPNFIHKVEGLTVTWTPEQLSYGVVRRITTAGNNTTDVLPNAQVFLAAYPNAKVGDIIQLVLIKANGGNVTFDNSANGTFMAKGGGGATTFTVMGRSFAKAGANRQNIYNIIVYEIGLTPKIEFMIIGRR